jgi:ubiquinone/menaquinone biosynthesis C-methylase UbiE
MATLGCVTTSPAPGGPPWAAMFDSLSDSYDQAGVPFFTTIADRLVAELDPRPGERFLDVGSGRGAVTFPVAAAVGAAGRVDAVDLAPGMVRHLSEDLAARGVTNTTVTLGDATDPQPPAPPYDAVASSLVLFFLPDPVGALTRWRALLSPGGRVGVTTFAPWRGTWAALSELAEQYEEESAPIRGRDVYDSDAGVEQLLAGAGFADVRTLGVTYSIPFVDVDQWRRWSAGTALASLWRRSDEADHPAILARAAELLEEGRDASGRITLEVDLRYTFGRA